MIFAIFVAGIFHLRKQQLMPRSSPVPAPAHSSGRRVASKKGQASMRFSNAGGASAGQGGLPWRQEVAPLDAFLGFRKRSCLTPCVSVTGGHRRLIGLPAQIRTWIGRPLRRKERGEQKQCRWDNEQHKPLS